MNIDHIKDIEDDDVDDDVEVVDVVVEDVVEVVEDVVEVVEEDVEVDVEDDDVDVEEDVEDVVEVVEDDVEDDDVEVEEDVEVVEVVEVDVEDDDVSCCVCFNSQTETETEKVMSLIDTVPINLETIIKSACNKHYICIGCLYKIVTDYTNHPINENNSHVYCPYPFSDCLTVAGTKNVFEHNLILKLLDESEAEEFMAHARRFSFPGFTLINCPCYNYTLTFGNRLCNSPVLIENELIKSAGVGELLIQCDQNEECYKCFCYTCKSEVSRYERECKTCKLLSENENPNIFNRYFIKDSIISDVSINEETFSIETYTKYFDEDNYLFYNKNITVDIALEHIKRLIEHGVNCLCPICKIDLYKTESCNAMKHHNIERCYACGRIGNRIGGLHNNHWNANGITGCYRFDYDRFIGQYIPDYRCDTVCHNHELGECQKTDHVIGIQKLNKIRQMAMIYHAIASLLPIIRYDVLFSLYNTYAEQPQFYDLLPFKQTFVFLEYRKDLILDYTEETMYQHLDLIHPEFIDKSYSIEPSHYINEYTILRPLPPQIPPIPLLPPIPPRPLLPPLQPTQLLLPNIEELELNNALARLNIDDEINNMLNEILNTPITINVTERQPETQPLINRYNYRRYRSYMSDSDSDSDTDVDVDVNSYTDVNSDTDVDV